jgi:hypothetical protein
MILPKMNKNKIAKPKLENITPQFLDSQKSAKIQQNNRPELKNEPKKEGDYLPLLILFPWVWDKRIQINEHKYLFNIHIEIVTINSIISDNIQHVQSIYNELRWLDEKVIKLEQKIEKSIKNSIIFENNYFSYQNEFEILSKLLINIINKTTKYRRHLGRKYNNWDLTKYIQYDDDIIDPLTQEYIYSVQILDLFQNEYQKKQHKQQQRKQQQHKQQNRPKKQSNLFEKDKSVVETNQTDNEGSQNQGKNPDNSIDAKTTKPKVITTTSSGLSKPIQTKSPKKSSPKIRPQTYFSGDYFQSGGYVYNRIGDYILPSSPYNGPKPDLSDLGSYNQSHRSHYSHTKSILNQSDGGDLKKKKKSKHGGKKLLPKIDITFERKIDKHSEQNKDQNVPQSTPAIIKSSQIIRPVFDKNLYNLTFPKFEKGSEGENSQIVKPKVKIHASPHSSTLPSSDSRIRIPSPTSSFITHCWMDHLRSKYNNEIENEFFFQQQEELYQNYLLECSLYDDYLNEQFLLYKEYLNNMDSYNDMLKKVCFEETDSNNNNNNNDMNYSTSPSSPYKDYSNRFGYNNWLGTSDYRNGLNYKYHHKSYHDPIQFFGNQNYNYENSFYHVNSLNTMHNLNQKDSLPNQNNQTDDQNLSIENHPNYGLYSTLTYNDGGYWLADIDTYPDSLLCIDTIQNNNSSDNNTDSGQDWDDKIINVDGNNNNIEETNELQNECLENDEQNQNIPHLFLETKNDISNDNNNNNNNNNNNDNHNGNDLFSTPDNKTTTPSIIHSTTTTEESISLLPLYDINSSEHEYYQSLLHHCDDPLYFNTDLFDFENYPEFFNFEQFFQIFNSLQFQNSFFEGSFFINENSNEFFYTPIHPYKYYISSYKDLYQHQNPNSFSITVDERKFNQFTNALGFYRANKIAAKFGKKWATKVVNGKRKSQNWGISSQMKFKKLTKRKLRQYIHNNNNNGDDDDDDNDDDDALFEIQSLKPIRYVPDFYKKRRELFKSQYKKGHNKLIDFEHIFEQIQHNIELQFEEKYFQGNNNPPSPPIIKPTLEGVKNEPSPILGYENVISNDVIDVRSQKSEQKDDEKDNHNNCNNDDVDLEKFTHRNNLKDLHNIQAQKRAKNLAQKRNQQQQQQHLLQASLSSDKTNKYRRFRNINEFYPISSHENAYLSMLSLVHKQLKQKLKHKSEKNLKFLNFQKNVTHIIITDYIRLIIYKKHQDGQRMMINTLINHVFQWLQYKFSLVYTVSVTFSLDYLFCSKTNIDFLKEFGNVIIDNNFLQKKAEKSIIINKAQSDILPYNTPTITLNSQITSSRNILKTPLSLHSGLFQSPLNSPPLSSSLTTKLQPITNKQSKLKVNFVQDSFSPISIKSEHFEPIFKDEYNLINSQYYLSARQRALNPILYGLSLPQPHEISQEEVSFPVFWLSENRKKLSNNQQNNNLMVHNSADFSFDQFENDQNTILLHFLLNIFELPTLPHNNIEQVYQPIEYSPLPTQSIRTKAAKLDPKTRHKVPERNPKPDQSEKNRKKFHLYSQKNVLKNPLDFLNIHHKSGNIIDILHDPVVYYCNIDYYIETYQLMGREMYSKEIASKEQGIMNKSSNSVNPPDSGLFPTTPTSCESNPIDSSIFDCINTGLFAEQLRKNQITTIDKRNETINKIDLVDNVDNIDSITADTNNNSKLIQLCDMDDIDILNRLPPLLRFAISLGDLRFDNPQKGTPQGKPPDNTRNDNDDKNDEQEQSEKTEKDPKTKIKNRLEKMVINYLNETIKTRIQTPMINLGRGLSSKYPQLAPINLGIKNGKFILPNFANNFVNNFFSKNNQQRNIPIQIGINSVSHDAVGFISALGLFKRLQCQLGKKEYESVDKNTNQKAKKNDKNHSLAFAEPIVLPILPQPDPKLLKYVQTCREQEIMEESNNTILHENKVDTIFFYPQHKKRSNTITSSPHRPFTPNVVVIGLRSGFDPNKNEFGNFQNPSKFDKISKPSNCRTKTQIEKNHTLFKQIQSSKLLNLLPVYYNHPISPKLIRIEPDCTRNQDYCNEIDPQNNQNNTEVCNENRPRFFHIPTPFDRLLANYRYDQRSRCGNVLKPIITDSEHNADLNEQTKNQNTSQYYSYLSPFLPSPNASFYQKWTPSDSVRFHRQLLLFHSPFVVQSHVQKIFLLFRHKQYNIISKMVERRAQLGRFWEKFFRQKSIFSDPHFSHTLRVLGSTAVHQKGPRKRNWERKIQLCAHYSNNNHILINSHPSLLELLSGSILPCSISHKQSSKYFDYSPKAPTERKTTIDTTITIQENNQKQPKLPLPRIDINAIFPPIDIQIRRTNPIILTKQDKKEYKKRRKILKLFEKLQNLPNHSLLPFYDIYATSNIMITGNHDYLYSLHPINADSGNYNQHDEKKQEENCNDDFRNFSYSLKQKHAQKVNKSGPITPHYCHHFLKPGPENDPYLAPIQSDWHTDQDLYRSIYGTFHRDLFNLQKYNEILKIANTTSSCLLKKEIEKEKMEKKIVIELISDQCGENVIDVVKKSVLVNVEPLLKGILKSDKKTINQNELDKTDFSVQEGHSNHAKNSNNNNNNDIRSPKIAQNIKKVTFKTPIEQIKTFQNIDNFLNTIIIERPDLLTADSDIDTLLKDITSPSLLQHYFPPKYNYLHNFHQKNKMIQNNKIINHSNKHFVQFFNFPAPNQSSISYPKYISASDALSIPNSLMVPNRYDRQLNMEKSDRIKQSIERVQFSNPNTVRSYEFRTWDLPELYHDNGYRVEMTPIEENLTVIRHFNQNYLSIFDGLDEKKEKDNWNEFNTVQKIQNNYERVLHEHRFDYFTDYTKSRIYISPATVGSITNDYFHTSSFNLDTAYGLLRRDELFEKLQKIQNDENEYEKLIQKLNPKFNHNLLPYFIQNDFINRNNDNDTDDFSENKDNDLNNFNNDKTNGNFYFSSNPFTKFALAKCKLLCELSELIDIDSIQPHNPDTPSYLQELLIYNDKTQNYEKLNSKNIKTIPYKILYKKIKNILIKYHQDQISKLNSSLTTPSKTNPNSINLTKLTSRDYQHRLDKIELDHYKNGGKLSKFNSHSLGSNLPNFDIIYGNPYLTFHHEFPFISDLRPRKLNIHEFYNDGHFNVDVTVVDEFGNRVKYYNPCGDSYRDDVLKKKSTQGLIKSEIKLQENIQQNIQQNTPKNTPKSTPKSTPKKNQQREQNRHDLNSNSKNPFDLINKTSTIPYTDYQDFGFNISLLSLHSGLYDDDDYNENEINYYQNNFGHKRDDSTNKQISIQKQSQKKLKYQLSTEDDTNRLFDLQKIQTVLEYDDFMNELELNIVQSLRDYYLSENKNMTRKELNFALQAESTTTTTGTGTTGAGTGTTKTTLFGPKKPPSFQTWEHSENFSPEDNRQAQLFSIIYNPKASNEYNITKLTQFYHELIQYSRCNTKNF